MIDATTLPPAHEIEHPAIREAAQRQADAHAALTAKQRELARHLDAEEAALQADAVEAEEALSAGRPRPKRKHAAAWTAKRDDLEHEVRVGRLAIQRAQRDLQAVLDEAGQEWTEDLASEVEAAEAAWSEALAILEAAHQQRIRAYQRRRAVGGEVPSTALLLEPARCFDNVSGDRLQLAWLDDPGQRYRQRVGVRVEDAIVALQALGEPEPPVPMPGSGVATAIKHSLDHAKSVSRGYAPDEDNAPAIRQMPRRTFVTTDGAAFHMPGGDDE